MQVTRTIATDVSVSLFVYFSLPVTRLSPAKTAERIEILFGVENSAGSRKIVLDGEPDHPTTRGRVGKRCPLHFIHREPYKVPL